MKTLPAIFSLWLCGCGLSAKSTQPANGKPAPNENDAIIKGYREFENLFAAKKYDQLWGRLDKKTQSETTRDFFITIAKGIRESGQWERAKTMAVANRKGNTAELRITWPNIPKGTSDTQLMPMVFEDGVWKVSFDDGFKKGR